MSHFPVLVVTNDNAEKTLIDVLQPFHEYECTGVDDQYVIDVDVTDEANAEWERAVAGNFTDGQTKEEYLKDYGNWQARDGGRFVKRTNQNSKWDWWQVGGRWSGLLVRDGLECDSARKMDLDLETMRLLMCAHRRKKVVRVYEQIAAKTKLTTPQITEQWGRFRILVSDSTNQWEQCGRPGRLWDFMPERNSEFLLLNSAGFSDIGKWGFDGANVPETESDPFVWCESAPPLSVFAVLDEKGQWHEKGRMGWWAMVSDEKEDWPSQFQALFDAVQPEQYMTIVDGHLIYERKTTDSLS